VKATSPLKLLTGSIEAQLLIAGKEILNGPVKARDQSLPILVWLWGITCEGESAFKGVSVGWANIHVSSTHIRTSTSSHGIISGAESPALAVVSLQSYPGNW
jgi:hypothetical protein